MYKNVQKVLLSVHINLQTLIFWSTPALKCKFNTWNTMHFQWHFLYSNTWVFKPVCFLTLSLHTSQIYLNIHNHISLGILNCTIVRYSCDRKYQNILFCLSQYLNFTSMGLFLLEDTYLWLTNHAYKWISFIDRQTK